MIDQTVGLETNRPTVSVVIPYYMRKATLPRALKSVEAQSLKNIEVIIVDDASPEPLLSPFIAGLALPLSIEVIRLDENVGPSKARNVGIKAARGDFVAFLDSDDEWLETKLQEQVDAIATAANPDYAVCLAQTFIRHPTHIEARRVWRPPDERIGEYLIMNAGAMQTSSVLVSRRLALEILFDEKMRQFEDMLFMILAWHKGAEFLFVEKCLFYWYRDGRDDQLSRKINLVSGFQFLKRVANILNERETLAFKVVFLGPILMRKQPLTFCGAALKALWCRAVSLKRVARIILLAIW